MFYVILTGCICVSVQMRWWTPLPSIIYGTLASLSGLLYLLLPETLGKPLLDSVQEVEQMDASLNIR